VTDDGKRLRVVEQIKDVLDSARPEDIAPDAGVSINVTGKGGNRIAGRDFYDQSVRVEKVTPPVVIVKTGEGVLNAEEKAEVQRLVNEVVDGSGARRKRRTHASVYAQLKRFMHVNSYAEILRSDFSKAVAYLRRMGAIDNSLPSAHKRNPHWRQKRIAAIHARCKERGWEEWRVTRMKEKFGRGSMTQMPDSEIEALYRAVMSKK